MKSINTLTILLLLFAFVLASPSNGQEILKENNHGNYLYKGQVYKKDSLDVLLMNQPIAYYEYKNSEEKRLSAARRLTLGGTILGVSAIGYISLLASSDNGVDGFFNALVFGPITFAGLVTGTILTSSGFLKLRNSSNKRKKAIDLFNSSLLKDQGPSKSRLDMKLSSSGAGLVYTF